MPVVSLSYLITLARISIAVARMDTVGLFLILEEKVSVFISLQNMFAMDFSYMAYI
jgi:hypothetical protein